MDIYDFIMHQFDCKAYIDAQLEGVWRLERIEKTTILGCHEVVFQRDALDYDVQFLEVRGSKVRFYTNTPNPDEPDEEPIASPSAPISYMFDPDVATLAYKGHYYRIEIITDVELVLFDLADIGRGIAIHNYYRRMG